LPTKFQSLFLGEDTTANLLGLFLLILLYFLAGILATTKRVKQLNDLLEGNILSSIPSYIFLKGMGETAVGLSSQELKEVVLVDIEEVWQIGFLMERIDKDLNAVCIPGAPNPMSRDVVIIKWDRLKILDIREIDTLLLYKKFGVNAKKISNR